MDPQILQAYLGDDAARRSVQEAADLPTERARNGSPTLSLKGLRLHSAVNPEDEAETQVRGVWTEIQQEIRAATNEPVTCIVLGPGLGYAVRALGRFATEDGVSERLHVMCVEIHPPIARKALQLKVWEPCPLPVQWTILDSGDPTLTTTGAKTVFLRCTPGYRVDRDLYEQAVARAGGPNVSERPMRILVPTPLYGGSYPTALHSAAALRALGHQVELLDLSDHYPLFKLPETIISDQRHQRALQGLMTTYLAEFVVARALDWRADLVWAVAQTPLTPSALQELRHEGVHSAFWFVEDYTLFSYWRELAPHFDGVFTIQRGAFHEELRALGVRNVFYLPCAANPDVHRPVTLSAEERSRFGSQVSFVGAGYRNRQMVFAHLALPDFKIWGNDWPEPCPSVLRVQEKGRRLSTEETVTVYCATKVNLNLHSSSHHSDVNPYGDFLNPRTFEIAACGAFQLVDARSELSGLFEEGVEIAVFRKVEEIPELVGHYLAHEDERREMAERARQRVLREHTYAHRLHQALAFLESRLPRLAGRKRGPNYVASLKESVADDPELVAFLSAYPDGEELDLDRIVSDIKLGAGELSRPEALFLLMKEFRDWGREKGVIQ